MLKTHEKLQHNLKSWLKCIGNLLYLHYKSRSRWREEGLVSSQQGTRIWPEITCKKIPCYMRDSAEFSHVKQIVEAGFM